MERIGGSPFAWLKFDGDGALADPAQAEAVRAMTAEPGIGDVVVISHGWKNDHADADELYRTLWTNVAGSLRNRAAAGVAVVGVEWPAKAYRSDFDSRALLADAAGGTLSVGGAGARRRDFTEGELQRAIAEFEDGLGASGADVAAAARDVVAAGALDPTKAGALFNSASRLLGAATTSDTEIQEDARPLAAFDAHPRLLALAKPPSLKAQPGLGAAQGLGTAVGEVFAGPRAAVARFLNQLTYFEMKKRAGIVGRRLGAEVLPGLALPGRARLHLVGHSFGARLVTAAASGLPRATPPYSLCLLQGAFSHNAMAKVVREGLPGAFADVVGRPTGPIVMTHTHNDEACTLWYAIASRLSRDMATAIGDKDDAFGAMGANGAQKLAPESLAPDVADETFRPVAGKVNRFRADGYILKTATVDAHNNVTNPTVGRLVAAILDMPGLGGPSA